MKRILTIVGVVTLLLAASATAFAARKAAALPTAATGEVRDKTTGMEFVFVKGGCFEMGSSSDAVNQDETPQHKVCVGDFYLGKYEVTREQWQKVTGTIPSGNDRCVELNCPVENIGWKDATAFIQALNKKSGAHYRLPTEAEWEFAARSGGKDERYAGGSDLDAVAWHGGNSGSAPHPVGTKKPNGLGLHDMTGNVEEWCSDYFNASYYGSSPGKNPKGPESGTHRVQRGGHYEDEDARWLRTVHRRKDVENLLMFERYGLRLVMPVKTPAGKK